MGPYVQSCPSSDRSRSMVHIAYNKSDLFPEHIALNQEFPLSLDLFIIFMDRISRHKNRPKNIILGTTASIFCIV